MTRIIKLVLQMMDRHGAFRESFEVKMPEKEECPWCGFICDDEKALCDHIEKCRPAK